ncbi:hypothetical protein [Roseivirga spongicola]|uniref:Uncharacterized protein n=1 Tax=Roseivirga spongicola TaxID=333140 RepID=A0A150XCJ1_9BACT|nr:hypothetical protein [Roseivirga spongicola]KYG76412.1 hypothetical protein AWW68_19390 [Roseivirga spongicola]WPZ08730.1 hypothetical protein T7867_10720 [Roseivirga spongicola]
MLIQDFKDQFESHLSTLEDMILRMPEKGNTESESQAIVLKNRLGDLWHSLNGTEQEDLIFEYDELPEFVQECMSDFDEDGNQKEECVRIIHKLNQIGWAANYGLDCVLYDFRRLSDQERKDLSC